MDKGHIATEKELARLEKELTKVYKEASKELQTKLEKQLNELKIWEDKNEQLKIDNLEEYNRKRQNKLFAIDRSKNIIKNLSEDISTVNQQAMAIINDTNLNIYALNHNYILNSIKSQGADISFQLYNKQIVASLLKKNAKLFPKRKIDIPKDLRWNNKKIKAELLKGLLNGESIPKIAKRLKEVTDMNNNSAIRNARTSVTNVQNKSRQDGFKYAENLGVEIQKEWVSAIDSRTRESHARINGEVVETDDIFSNGLKYPGDPNGSSEEVYNCRCTVIPVLKKDYSVTKEREKFEKSLIDIEQIGKSQLIDIANSFEKGKFDKSATLEELKEYIYKKRGK